MTGAGRRHVLVPGPWRHVDVSANGVRLHVALGETFDVARPLVVLVHGFAQHWWSWRHIIPVLDAAGYAVAALDLRGCGASDQTPRGYDAASTAADVAGVIAELGSADAVLVGHDTGARAAWVTAAYAPERVRGLVSVSAPHPLDRRHRLRPVHGLSLPGLAERRIGAADAVWVDRRLRQLTADPHTLDVEATDPYREILRDWPGARGALGPLRADRAARGALRTELAPGVDVPLLLVRGDEDRVLPPAAQDVTRAYGHGSLRTAELARVGHLPAEEDPLSLTEVLAHWLRGVPD